MNRATIRPWTKNAFEILSKFVLTNQNVEDQQGSEHVEDDHHDKKTGHAFIHEITNWVKATSLEVGRKEVSLGTTRAH
jgi:hypothetical protein